MPSIVLAVAALVLFSSALLWGAAIQRWRAGMPLIPYSAHSPAPWGLLDLALAVGTWLLLNLAAAATSQSAVPPVSGGGPRELDSATQIPLLLIGSLATLATCLMVVAVLWIRHRVTAKELGWDARQLVGDAVLGAKAFAMLAPIVYGLQLLVTQIVVSKHPMIELLKKDPDPKLFAIVGFAAVLVAPLAEEFLFRVLLQGWLERTFAWQEKNTDRLVFGGRISEQAKDPDSDPPQENPSGIKAIILSSLFFALSHWSHGPDPIPLFVFALGLGYIYQRTQRIAPCIVLHVLLNLCSLTGLWLSVAT